MLYKPTLSRQRKTYICITGIIGDVIISITIHFRQHVLRYGSDPKVKGKIRTNL